MPGTRRVGVGAYTQTRGGRIVQVRRHTKQVAFGSPGGTWGRGIFSLRRATRHVTGRPTKGKRPSPRGRNRWSKKKTAAAIALGICELIGWLLFRTLGLGLGIAAALLSAGAIGLNRVGQQRQPARRAPARRPPGVKASRPIGETVVATTKGKGKGTGRPYADRAREQRPVTRGTALWEPEGADRMRDQIVRQFASDKIQPDEIRFTRQGGVWIDRRKTRPGAKPVRIGSWGSQKGGGSGG